MIHGRIPFGFSVLHLIALVLLALPDAARAQTRDENQRLGFAIYKELVEINTVTATGDTAAAADAMAARLLAAGFAPEDVKVFKPAPRKGNLVARLRGSGSRKPILLLAHIDVVPAKREDWSTDPFKLVEQDGYLLWPRHKRRQVHGCGVRRQPHPVQAGRI